jgi:hypothetical protein
MCRNAGTCKRAICFFAHSDEQLRRTVYSCMPGEDVDTPAAASEHTVAAAAAEAAGMVNASDACLSCVTGFLLGLQRGGQDMMEALLTSQFPGAEEAAAKAAAKAAAAAAGASSPAGSVCGRSDASAAPGTPPAADAPPANAAASSNGSAAPSPASSHASGPSEMGSPSSAAAAAAADSGAPGSEGTPGVLCCLCHGPMVTTMKAAKAPAGLPASAGDAWGCRGGMEQAHMLGALGMLPEELPPYMRDMLYMNGAGDGSELMYPGAAGFNNGGSMMQHIMLQRQMAAAQQYNYMQTMGMGGGAGGYGASAAAAAAAEEMRHQMLLQQLRGPAARGKQAGWGGVQAAVPPVDPMGVGHELGMGGATLSQSELSLLNAAALSGNRTAVLQQQQLAAAAAAAGGFAAVPMQPASTGGIQLADLQAALEMLATPMTSGMVPNAAAMQGADLSTGLAVGGVGPCSAAAAAGLVGQPLAMQPPSLGLSAVAAAAGAQVVPMAPQMTDFAAQAATMTMLSAQDHLSARPAGPPAMLATMQAQQQQQQAQAQAAAAAAAAAQQQAARNWQSNWHPQAARNNLADPRLLQGPAAGVQAMDNWWQGCGAGHELGL